VLSRSATCLRPQLISETRGGCVRCRPSGQATGSKSKSMNDRPSSSGKSGSEEQPGCVARAESTCPTRQVQSPPSAARTRTVPPAAAATATNLLHTFEPDASVLSLMPGLSRAMHIDGVRRRPSPPGQSCQHATVPWSVSAATSPSQPTESLADRQRCSAGQLHGTKAQHRRRSGGRSRTHPMQRSPAGSAMRLSAERSTAAAGREPGASIARYFALCIEYTCPRLVRA
jgi:hypothetical protein